MGPTIALIVFVFVALVIGGLFALGAPVLAVPIFLVVMVGMLGGLVMSRTVMLRQLQYRRMRQFREQAKAQRVPPATPQDRHTVV